MASLQLYFLGPLEIYSDNQPLVKPPTLKSQSVLAYLVYHRSLPQLRDQLAGIFFGERTEHKARRSLSTTLWHIHRCLAEKANILSDSQTVQFDPQNKIWLDVWEFEVKAACTDLASLCSAVGLYRGDFLEGFYDDWIVSERYRLESLYIETLGQLMILYEAGEDHQAAMATALRLLSRDALREDAYRVVMRAYCHLGQRKAALEQYERCRQTLLNELGAEPLGETRELYQAILKGRFEVGSLDFRSVTALTVEHTGRDPLDVTSTVRLIGREQESVFLDDCWRAAVKGNTRLALISGEAGVGKTRLVEAFANQLRWQGIHVLWGRCYEFEHSLPYQPIADALRSSLSGLNHDQLASFPAWVLREAARLVPDLFEEHTDNRRESKTDSEVGLPAASDKNPEQNHLFAGVTRFLAELSTQDGLLIVLEDLHWASESTLLLLHYLSCYLSEHPVLIIGTFRPEASGLQDSLRALYGELAREGLVRQLELSRLSPTAVETIILEMSGAGEAVGLLAKRLYQETEGNPFFLMEIIKALFETNAIWLKEGAWQGDFNRLSAEELPLTLNVSKAVQARVDYLGEAAQDSLRIAAVLGREFNYELFHAAWGKDEEATLEALDQLLRHRLIEEKIGPNESDFAFTHHKIQEIVYQRLPRHRCLHLHARVGAAMERLYADELEMYAAKLAYHFEQARYIKKSLSGKAITYLLLSGKQAVGEFANQEAVTYYQRGLDILRNQPETAQNLRYEVELQLALAVPTSALKGYASPETKRLYGRAYILCQKLGDAPELFTSLVGLTRYYGITGDLETMGIMAKKLLAIAKASGETDLLMEAHRQMGNVLFSLGKMEEAREYWENGLSLYKFEFHEQYAHRFGHDPIITFLNYSGMALWLMGYPEQALAKSQTLNNLVPTFTHPPSQALGYCQLAMQACLRSAAKDALDHAQAAIYIAQLHGLSAWMIFATILKGWALFEQGKEEEGEAMLKQGIQAWQSTGFAHFIPFFLLLQADACLKSHKLQEGMGAVMAAQAIVKSGFELYWEAELYRLQGELLRALGTDDNNAERCFRLSLETARHQGARMLELRAAVSLAQLWQDQPRAAQQVLAEAYDKFTEGFDTCDLKRARDLLDELSQHP